MTNLRAPLCEEMNRDAATPLSLFLSFSLYFSLFVTVSISLFLSFTLSPCLSLSLSFSLFLFSPCLFLFVSPPISSVSLSFSFSLPVRSQGVGTYVYVCPRPYLSTCQWAAFVTH